MKKCLFVLVIIALTGCAGTGDVIRFSGMARDYQEPKEGNVAYLHLETEKKTDGFGLEPYPHTAIIYERCTTKEDGGVKFGYLGDLKISRKSKHGNPASLKVKSGKPIFLAFGLMHPVNNYYCTSKYIFTPEHNNSYSFVSSITWSECPTKASIIVDKNKVLPIKGIEVYDKAKDEELIQLGVNLSRAPC